MPDGAVAAEVAPGEAEPPPGQPRIRAEVRRDHRGERLRAQDRTAAVEQRGGEPGEVRLPARGRAQACASQKEHWCSAAKVASPIGRL